MGGGNGQKAKMAREKNMEKAKPTKGMYVSIIFSCLLMMDFTLCRKSA